MKKLIFILFVLPIFSCNSDKKKDAPASENLQGVQNVNGNIPDTTNAINIDGKKDSASVKDSTH